eukprot:Tbor_TRINITY_DN5439_c2_g1::TRINITY_DN5439_c2_g1_i1::g.24359::m.24359
MFSPETPSSSAPTPPPQGSPHETYFQKAITYMYGSKAELHKVVPPEIGNKHINVLLGRHPYHPWNPDMHAEHPCYSQNLVFGNCMNSEVFSECETHTKHVNCFHPYKVDLMKCLTRVKKLSDKKGASDTS